MILHAHCGGVVTEAQWVPAMDMISVCNCRGVVSESQQ